MIVNHFHRRSAIDRPGRLQAISDILPGSAGRSDSQTVEMHLFVSTEGWCPLGLFIIAV